MSWMCNDLTERAASERVESDDSGDGGGGGGDDRPPDAGAARGAAASALVSAPMRLSVEQVSLETLMMGDDVSRSLSSSASSSSSSSPLQQTTEDPPSDADASATVTADDTGTMGDTSASPPVPHRDATADIRRRRRQLCNAFHFTLDERVWAPNVASYVTRYG